MLNSIIKVMVILVLVQWIWNNISQSIFAYYDAKEIIELEQQWEKAGEDAKKL